ncbi:MAG: hypothetical protein V1705_00705 [bacterium]
MKTEYLISFLGAIFLMAGSFVLSQTADVQYPVKELGNCPDQASCRSYCDESANLRVCLDFAKKNNLMSEKELAMAEKFAAAGGVGPGGCTSKDNCEAYCNDISRINECISYAEKNDLIPPEELAEAKQVQAAIARGVKPPPCGNKKACDAYCEESDHMEECITFGAEAGFIQGKELEDAQKMLQAVKRGVKAPPCKGKEACDEYCSQPDNMELCMNFAIEAGFMNEQEKADSQKMLQALKKGVKPPPCKGKEACDEYCSQEEHFEECMNFAVAAGFMSEEDAVMARKTGGKSPGDCKGKEACEAFCNNPDNQETCFNFAKENGLIPEEDMKRMEEGTQRFKESLEQAPAPVMDCLNSQIGVDLMEKIKSGTVMPPKDIGDKMRGCYETMMPPSEQGGPGAGGMMPPGEGGGQPGPQMQQMMPSQGEMTQPPSQEQMQQIQQQQMQQIQQQMQQQYGPPPEGGGEMMSPPTQEEIQQIQQQQQQQMQQQMQQQYGPPPTEQVPPQSFFDKAKNFLFLGSISAPFLRER